MFADLNIRAGEVHQALWSHLGTSGTSQSRASCLSTAQGSRLPLTPLYLPPTKGLGRGFALPVGAHLFPRPANTFLSFHQGPLQFPLLPVYLYKGCFFARMPKNPESREFPEPSKPDRLSPSG